VFAGAGEQSQLVWHRGTFVEAEVDVFRVAGDVADAGPAGRVRIRQRDGVDGVPDGLMGSRQCSEDSRA